MHRHSPWSSFSLTIALSAAAGLSVSAGVLLLSALILLKFMDDLKLISWFSLIALGAGAFSGAYFGGKRHRRRGLVCGVLCGAAMYFVTAAAGLAAAGSLTCIKKLLLLTIAGGAGGVSGVNSKRPRGLMD